MRIVFMGSPAFSVPTLEALAKEHEIIACYTQPPKPRGRRGKEVANTPVHDAANALGIEVRTPKTLKVQEEQAAFAALKADVAVVVAYGLLLPREILHGTRLGCYNGHASLLPRWRGAAPIHRAIMAGDTETGMMIMKMDEGLDTGPVAMTTGVPIDPDMTTGELHDVLANAGAPLMVDAMNALERDALPLTPQAEEGVTYAKKIDKAEARLDWSRTASTVHNHIRGLSPFPGAWCEMLIAGQWERVKLLASTRQQPTNADEAITAPCADGAVYITKLQMAGSKALSAVEFQRGHVIDAIR
ncbi:MAG: methionyl-tRNA formyltransferase [Pseudomonadota bacterium]